MKNGHGNVSEKIISYLGRNIYKDPNHPLGIIKHKIEDFFSNANNLALNTNHQYKIYDSFNPIVTI